MFALPLALLAATLPACAERLDFDVEVRVVDEDGAPVDGAVLLMDGIEYKAGSSGKLGFHDLEGAALVVISADGYLPEPVILGRDDSVSSVEVKLIASRGGRRWAMHSSGDVMFGRRYNQPTEGEPLIPVDAVEPATRAVVSHIAPAFSVADLRTINLETVISELPDSAAYPGKRFILNSLPGTLAGVHELGVDAVDLANNHARDYMDVGVAETLSALEAANIPYFGASVGPDGADEPYLTTVNGVTVGVLGWTTVNGSFVNDNYPDGDAPIPPDLQPTEFWQYVTRPWGYQGVEWNVPTAARRIGEVWRMFEDVESSLSEPTVAEVWASIVAVYPEMQDWVARRGHGGAAAWNDQSAARIAELDAIADVVVVQLHSGFQFQIASSSGTRLAARRAIDAGADIVICHHPHVLQGADWYKGKLIVYSLGNFVFDQDFLATFPSAFLRTIWDGDQLLEARFVPVELVGYKTRPVADRAARRTLLRLWEMSAMRAQADRDINGDVRVFELEPDTDTDTIAATMRLERNTARITKDSVAPESHAIRVHGKRIARIAYNGLVDPRLGLPRPGPGTDAVNGSGGLNATDGDILVGRDLLGWGHFEDEVADGLVRHDTHWALDEDSTSKVVMTDGDTPEGIAYLRLSRYYTNEQSVIARPVARIPMWRHRLYRDLGDGVAEPMDPEPSYSLYLRARRKGSGTPAVRMDLYHFDDTDPTEDPSSTLIDQYITDIEVPNDNEWHTLHMDIPASAFQSGDQTANMVLLYLRLDPPYKSKTVLDIDDLNFIEWRDAARMPDRSGLYEFVRNQGDQGIDLTIPVLPARSE